MEESEFQSLTQNALRQGRGWTNFLGWVLIICGILCCLTIVGAIFGWLYLWLGIVLRRAAKRASEHIDSADENSLVGYLEETSRFFRINGIATIVALGLSFMFTIVYIIVILIFFASGSPTGLDRWQPSGTRSHVGTTIPAEFPRTYLAVEDAGQYGKIVIQRSSRPPEVPVLHNGKQCYDAYLCLNDQCPGRKMTGGKPYIFAVIPPKETATADGMPETPEMPELFCPLCKEIYGKTTGAEKDRYDPTHIERYQTQEALAMIDEIREAFVRKNK